MNKKLILKRVLRKLGIVILYIFFIFVLAEIILGIGGLIVLIPSIIESEISIKKEDGFRILAIGESTTFGLGVNPEQAYPKQLEYILNKNYPEVNYEVINTAVPSQTSTSILRNIHHQIKKYDPDLVISLFGANDLIEELNGVNSRILFGNVYVPEWIANLRVYKIISVTKDFILHFPEIEKDGAWIFYDESQKDKNGKSIINLYYLDQLSLNYNDIISKIHQSDSEIAILSYMHRSPHLNNLYEAVALQNNITYIDLYVPYNNRSESWFKEDNWHPSKTGHEIMAQMIFENLINAELIPINKS